MWLVSEPHCVCWGNLCGDLRVSLDNISHLKGMTWDTPAVLSSDVSPSLGPSMVGGDARFSLKHLKGKTLEKASLLNAWTSMPSPPITTLGVYHFRGFPIVSTLPPLPPTFFFVNSKQPHTSLTRSKDQSQKKYHKTKQDCILQLLTMYNHHWLMFF